MWPILSFASVVCDQLHFERANIDQMKATSNPYFQYFECHDEEHPPCRVRLARHFQQ